MDRVRFGRALGKGARAAVRTAMEAAEAATATPSTPVRPAVAVPSARPAGQRPVVLPPERLAANVRPAARAAMKGVTAPFRKASRALWHELTGSFFALFALSFVGGVWHTRASAASAIAEERYRFYAFCFFAVLFGYFSVSSFVRARSRD